MYNIPEFYNELCRQFENSWQASGWDSEESQYILFVILSSIIRNNSSCSIVKNNSAPSILDVGCGQGDFYFFLKQRFSVDYTGLDFSDLMIEKAKTRYPEANFIKTDFLNSKVENFDYVVASGTFNFQIENQYDYIENSIRLCYQTCNKACSIAITSDLSENKFSEPIFYYCPKKILEICLKITNNVILNTSSVSDQIILILNK